MAPFVFSLFFLLPSFVVLLPWSAAAQARAPLRVVSAGPTGEAASIEEASEIRVVFSEPMAALGQVPLTLRPPFFRISPAVAGTFRWSGATVLIFTPARRLPLATRYDVTIAATAAALSGRTLAAPYRFSFTTPTARLLRTEWYRPGGRYDAAPLFVLRFNQPVKPADVLPHVRASFQSHLFTPPVIAAPAQTRLRTIDPGAMDAFTAKVQRARDAANATSLVPLEIAADWDKRRFKPSADMVVLRAAAEVPPESWVRLEVDGRVPSAAGLAVSGRPQNYTVQVEPAFFVYRVYCQSACDPDNANPVEFRGPVKAAAFAAALGATDVTDPRRERALTKARPRQRESWELDESSELSLEDAGFPAQPPASTLLLTLPADLKSSDGQTLGYTWAGLVETWHQRAFTSFGDGHGVWEHGGGPQLPFYARNFQNVLQWAARIEPSQLMPTLMDLQSSSFRVTPPAPGTPRRLSVTPDRIQSHGLDLSRVLSPSGHGLVWTAVQEGTPIDRARAARTRDNRPLVRASLVQVTNLGISVKDSPQNTLIWVTRLNDAAPVPGARVSIVTTGGQVAWTGTTGADGTALAPQTRLRNPRDWSQLAFVVTAEKDGDVAYTASDWHDGILPWEFGSPFDLDEADPLLRGTVFTDRGVYKPGEEVHFKAILRSNAPGGIRLLPEGTAVFVAVRDARDKVIDERTVPLTGWSTAEWTMTVPADGSLGSYSVRAILDRDRVKKDPAQPPSEEGEFDHREWKQTVSGGFLVAAYRRPDFRVDVTLAGQSRIAGDPLNAVVAARYLFGAPMMNRPTLWRFTRAPVFSAPSTIEEAFPSERWTFVGWSASEIPRGRAETASDTGTLAGNGQLALTLQTDLKAGVPYSYTLEGDVEDVSRQHIANRASLVVHPAPWYIGIRKIPLFNEQRNGLETQLVAVGLDGKPVAGVPIAVKLTQIQWQSVRRAEGSGFYGWETQRVELPAGSWTMTSAADPVPLRVELPGGGYFVLEARAGDTDGRHAVTREAFYSLGRGYTAWQRYDHNRIDLVADRSRYRPGDTARIMIQSPWERASALVTTEREGVRSHRQFTLTSTQESIDVPIGEGDIPNVYVSVLLVKGRSVPAGGAAATQAERASDAKIDDPSDPGKPAFKLGYVQLAVEDTSKRLTVAVAANRTEFRPANNATVTIDVKDRDGRGTASEVTLWAVDYGVLSLTAYRTPDVLGSVYVHKALQVLTEDGRQKIISRRVITPKGDTDGGGGGDALAADARQDFRVLAFWVGSITTNASGRASVEVKLPESLTTYRIMAVAGDRGSRFGFGDSEIRINKPVTLKAAFPRFLAVGDKASFGAVVTSQLTAAGPATVTVESLDPQVLQFAAAGPQTIEVPAGGSVEARFEAAGRAIGRARVRMTVRLNGETDAFQDVIPVEILVSPETVSAIGEAGEASPTASEVLRPPAGIVPTFGGLQIDLASTALVGLGEGARYLVEYPYGCAEQRGSRTLALLLSADLGGAFKLPGIDAAQLRPTVQSALRELERFQCDNGGFAYWPGACWSTSPYLTAYLLHVFKVAGDLKYTVDARVRERAYAYLEGELAQKPPVNESWWPSYTAWQTFAVKVLVEGGRNQDANLTRLYGYRERMPVFALAYLNDALVAAGEGTGLRSADLRRRIGNAILPEAATAHVEELNDPYLLWFWNSNVRSTAIALRSLVGADVPDAPYRGLVNWLLRARKDGRWGNTQENAIALEALVAYYRRFEAAAPDFTAAVRLGSAALATAQFQGRSAESRATEIPMARLLAGAPAGAEQPLTFTRTGTGTLFYSARLRYAVDRLFQQGLDQGIRIERSYAPYVEKGTRPASTAYQAGDLVRITLTLNLTKERRFVAVTDPLPAGFEPVESWFATSAQSLAQAQNEAAQPGDWTAWWQRGGFDHVERFDDRVRLFATRLSEGRHVFSYIARATTAGTFRTAPSHAEEMYEPEVFGRTATTVIEVKK
ncbi:MAG TPA: MG2 domain-containing protein [Vicinamibacterales bacterium]|nr:MG2 domain-containing protein [Vicinamibacterales bacterium]